MAYGIKTVILLIIFIIKTNFAIGQASGYFGAKQCLGVGVNMDLRGKIGANFSFEKVITDKFSLVLNTHYSKIKRDIDKSSYYLDLKGNIDNNSDEFYGFSFQGQTGVINSKVLKTNFSFRKYRYKKGAIAPYGSFFDFGLYFTLLNNEMNDYEINYRYNSSYYTFKYENISAKSSYYGLNISWGTKKFVRNFNFIELMGTFNIPLSLGNSKYEFIKPQEYAACVGNLYFMNQDYLNLSLKYGFAL